MDFPPLCGGRRIWLWRAVDDEGGVLDMLVQRRRNKHAALKLFKKLLKNQGVHPETIVTDKLASYRAAAKMMNLQERHRQGGMQENNRAETVIFRSDDESESSRSSNLRVQPNVSSQPTPPPTIPSIFNLT